MSATYQLTGVLTDSFSLTDFAELADLLLVYKKFQMTIKSSIYPALQAGDLVHVAMTTAFAFLREGGASLSNAEIDSRNRATSCLLSRFGCEITSPRDQVVFRRTFPAKASLRHTDE